MPDVAVRFADVGFCYRPGQWVVRGCSGAVSFGTSLAILGSNGCGKTTLLKLLLGALRPSEGRIEVVGATAFVPQLFQVRFDYTVLDLVLLGRAKRLGPLDQPSASDDRLALAALGRFGLADYASRSFHELSGGQRQLVILARALVGEARILILDEPTSALDLRNQELMLTWIARLAQRDGLAVVFTTHDPDHALAVADRTMLMRGVGTIALGPTRDVVTESNVSALYGVDLVYLSREIDGRTIEGFVHRRRPADER